jgi:hypothetical protein
MTQDVVEVVVTEVVEVDITGEVVEIHDDQADVVEVAEQGPAGPAGADAADQPIIMTAAETLGGHRAACASAAGAVYADPDDPDRADAIGITTGAADLGATVTLQTGGDMVEPSWSWSPGPIYVGPAGTLTQTPPASGTLMQIGVAIAATRVLVDVRSPIVR